MQHRFTLWVLIATLVILAAVVAVGIVTGKRRVKRALPGKDTHVES